MVDPSRKPHGHLPWLLFSILKNTVQCALEQETGDKTWVSGLSSVQFTFKAELFHAHPPKSDSLAAGHSNWTGCSSRSLHLHILGV